MARRGDRSYELSSASKCDSSGKGMIEMQVPISEITVGSRLRRLHEPSVLALMNSITEIGLIEPISVVTGTGKREGGGPNTVTFRLVAGLHRLEACLRLGWDEIEAKIVQMNEVECQLWEIDENLCRADLTELERSEHLVLRKRIYENKHPESRFGVAQAISLHRALGRRTNVAENFSATSFAKDTAEKAKVTDRTIRLSIRRAEKICPEVRDRIRDIPQIADSGVELDALAAMDHAQQLKAIELVASGQAAGIRESQKLLKAKSAKATTQVGSGEEANAKWRAKFNAALLNVGALLLEATPENREWARERLADEPMFGAEPPSGRSGCEDKSETVCIAPTHFAQGIRRQNGDK